MSLNPGGNNYGIRWNYTDPTKDGFAEAIVGTVVSLQEVQKRTFSTNGPGAPEFWPDGHPKFNIRIGLADENGELVTFTFQPAGKKQRTQDYGIHMALFHLTGDTDMMNLIGKTIRISTQTIDQNTGSKITYGLNAPRPFWVEEVNAGPYELKQELPASFKVPQVLADDSAHGGQVQPQPARPQNIYVPQPQQYQQPQRYRQQAPRPQGMVNSTNGMYYTAPQVQQPAPMPSSVNPMVPQPPAGMDPQIAQAMMQMGAVNVQPVDGEPLPY